MACHERTAHSFVATRGAKQTIQHQAWYLNTSIVCSFLQHLWQGGIKNVVING